MRHATGSRTSSAPFGLQLAPDRPAVGKAQDGDPALPDQPRRDPGSFLLPAGVWQQICDSSAQAPFAQLHMREKTSPVAARSVQILSRS
jgi:hypothetical protein